MRFEKRKIGIVLVVVILIVCGVGFLNPATAETVLEEVGLIPVSDPIPVPPIVDMNRTDGNDIDINDSNHRIVNDSNGNLKSVDITPEAPRAVVIPPIKDPIYKAT